MRVRCLAVRPMCLMAAVMLCFITRPVGAGANLPDAADSLSFGNTSATTICEYSLVHGIDFQNGGVGEAHGRLICRWVIELHVSASWQECVDACENAQSANKTHSCMRFSFRPTSGYEENCRVCKDGELKGTRLVADGLLYPDGYLRSKNNDWGTYERFCRAVSDVSDNEYLHVGVVIGASVVLLGVCSCLILRLTWSGYKSVRALRSTQQTSGHIEVQNWDADCGAYEGQLQSGMKHGYGRVTLKNGASYAGQWDKDVPHGHGLWHMPGDHGWIYNGQFYNGFRHGCGRCETFARRLWYDGDWKQGHQQGLGETGDLVHAEASGLVSPPIAHIWHMDAGEQVEHVAISKVSPESWEVIDLCLVAGADDDRQKTEFVKNNVSPSSFGPAQMVSRPWGFCFGVPEMWLPTFWGTLVITHIMENSPIWQWNVKQLHEFGCRALTIQPNSLIWRVNDIVGDVKRMVRKLCSQEQEQLHLYVTNPPHVRFQRCLQISNTKNADFLAIEDLKLKDMASQHSKHFVDHDSTDHQPDEPDELLISGNHVGEAAQSHGMIHSAKSWPPVGNIPGPETRLLLREDYIQQAQECFASRHHPGELPEFHSTTSLALPRIETHTSLGSFAPVSFAALLKEAREVKLDTAPAIPASCSVGLGCPHQLAVGTDN